MSHPKALLPAAALAILLPLLTSCGASTRGLIPARDAGPLREDFETVARVSYVGDGNCSPTATAIRATERDLQALPSSVNGRLRTRLDEGVANLRKRALALCAQALPSSTSTAASSSTSTSTSTTITKTTTLSPTETTTSTSGSAPIEPPGGGTQAPNEEGSEGIPPTGATSPETEPGPPGTAGPGERGASENGRGLGKGADKAEEP